jgi:hypothetical protein
MADQTYAWCFSHGRMHIFRPSSEYPDGAWCTARWMPLAGATEEDALADKQDRYGSAQFEHQLPFVKRTTVIEECARRYSDG